MNHFFFTCLRRVPFFTLKYTHHCHFVEALASFFSSSLFSPFILRRPVPHSSLSISIIPFCNVGQTTPALTKCYRIHQSTLIQAWKCAIRFVFQTVNGLTVTSWHTLFNTLHNNKIEWKTTPFFIRFSFFTLPSNSGTSRTHAFIVYTRSHSACILNII